MASTPISGMILSICIPTYNRGSFAEARLQELVPQLAPEVEILVLDNASTDDTRERVSRFLGPQVIYHRNICNIGGGANFFASVQKASGRWIWLLGDDDPVADDAITTALKESSSANANCVVIHFSWSCTNHAPQPRNIGVIRTIDELLSEFDIGTALFISSTLHRRSLFIENAPFYMAAMFTYGAHLAIYLHRLDVGTGEGKVSNRSLLKAQSAAGTWWSSTDAVIGLSSIPVFIRSTKGKRAYANAFWKWRGWALRMGFREFGDQAFRERWRYAYWFSLYNHLLNSKSARVLITDWILLLKRVVWQRRFPKVDFFQLLYGTFGWKWIGDKLQQSATGRQEEVIHEY